MKGVSNIRNPWLNKPKHVQHEGHKSNLAKKFFGQEELQVFLALDRPTGRKYYIVHKPFQFFMKSETNILEKKIAICNKCKQACLRLKRKYRHSSSYTVNVRTQKNAKAKTA